MHASTAGGKDIEALAAFMYEPLLVNAETAEEVHNASASKKLFKQRQETLG